VEPNDPRARRERFDRGELRIGGGELGGKASGLVFFNAMLAAEFDPAKYPEIETVVPGFAVAGTELFDQFVARTGLDEATLAGWSDHEIALAFQRVEPPAALVAGLRELLEISDRPLAVRSSSLMEDAIFRPFAGVYETKMVPNNQPDAAERLRRLVQAVELIYASTFFRAARSYIRATGKTLRDEKMAVVVQEVVGARHGDRFYPLLSGVARSVNFYPTGSAKPQEGVVNLALGLGKTIVDGGLSWTFSPARPKAPPPFTSIGQLLETTQRDFWCINLAPPAAEDPTAEAEHLVRAGLGAAEEDGNLTLVASTYDPRSDRLAPGTGRDGPRVLNFAPLLAERGLPLNAVVRELLRICEAAAGAPVELEFALKRDGRGRPSLGFLQVRPMFVSHDLVEIADEEVARPDLLLVSTRAMGNGRVQGLRDVVFVKPDTFEARHTRVIAGEIDALNRRLVEQGRAYVLVGFGRWGSSDSWLGIPVDWGQVSGAKVIVEATLPTMNVEPSQGAHFFHNILGNGVAYLSVHHAAVPGVDWEWLKAQPVVEETQFLRHAQLPAPLEIRVDGRSGRGGIWKG